MLPTSRSCSASLNATPLMASAHDNVSLPIAAASVDRVRAERTPPATAAGTVCRKRRRAPVEVDDLVCMSRHCICLGTLLGAGQHMLATLEIQPERWDRLRGA